MDNVSKILQRIKKEEIDPIPKWIFVLKRNLYWLAYFLSILFGAVAFSVILFAIQQADFVLVNHIGHSSLEMVLAMMPVTWLIGILVFLVVFMYGIKNTGRGYKLGWLKMINLYLISSMVLGTLIFISGGSQKLEQVFGSAIPGYESIEERKIEMWNKPEEGYLAGEIVLSAGDRLSVRSFDGTEWNIQYNEAFVAPILSLQAGEKVKVIGSVLEQGFFRAVEIRPWGGKPMRGMDGTGIKTR